MHVQSSDALRGFAALAIVSLCMGAIGIGLYANSYTLAFGVLGISFGIVCGIMAAAIMRTALG